MSQQNFNNNSISGGKIQISQRNTDLVIDPSNSHPDDVEKAKRTTDTSALTPNKNTVHNPNEESAAAALTLLGTLAGTQTASTPSGEATRGDVGQKGVARGADAESSP